MIEIIKEWFLRSKEIKQLKADKQRYFEMWVNREDRDNTREQRAYREIERLNKENVWLKDIIQAKILVIEKLEQEKK